MKTIYTRGRTLEPDEKTPASDFKDLRIPWAKPKMFGNEQGMVVDALQSTWISGGPYVDRFECEIPTRMGAEYGVAVSNGTNALYLALLAAGIGAGSEVIVPGFTFVAAAAMAQAVGATVVTADIDPHGWCLDPESVADKITSRTRAVIPVHLYGNVADMENIVALADRHGITVIEDAAEAAFFKRLGRSAGTFGAIGTLSFHATKTLTTGEGGMVLTDDRDTYERLRLLRDHGRDEKLRYWHEVVGYNFLAPQQNLWVTRGSGRAPRP